MIITNAGRLAIGNFDIEVILIGTKDIRQLHARIPTDQSLINGIHIVIYKARLFDIFEVIIKVMINLFGEFSIRKF